MFNRTRLLLIAMATVMIGLLHTGTGCVRRTITVESSPPGALVWVNDREIGRTPVHTDFLFYGTYDVRLVHPDAEPKLTASKTHMPIWEVIPLDFAAEVLPVDLHSRTVWQYDLHPRDDDPDALLSRARHFRERASISGQPGDADR